MWWLAIPAAGRIAKFVMDALDDPVAMSAKKRTVLESNLVRLRAELHAARVHRIAILGQPGAGKSSLLKKMTKSRVVPLPVIGAETDATNWAESSDCNLLSLYDKFTFVDVPGYDTSSHPVGVVLENFPFGEIDAYIFVVRGKLRGADEQIFQAIAKSGKPICIARSFAESANDNERIAITEDLQHRFGLAGDHHIGFFSNRNGDGIAEIFNAVKHN